MIIRITYRRADGSVIWESEIAPHVKSEAPFDVIEEEWQLIRSRVVRLGADEKCEYCSGTFTVQVIGTCPVCNGTNVKPRTPTEWVEVNENQAVRNSRKRTRNFQEDMEAWRNVPKEPQRGVNHQTDWKAEAHKLAMAIVSAGLSSMSQTAYDIRRKAVDEYNRIVEQEKS